jgi:twitching motility protein PilT
MDQATLNKLLKLGVDRGVSDIHFQVGSPPCYRLKGDLLKAKYDVLTPESTLTVAQTILGDKQVDLRRIFAEQDASYSIPGVSRFRASIFRQRGSIGIVLRVVPYQIREIEDLGLPGVVKEISNTQRGLILVTGPTGMGKSTTIAAMLQHINKTRNAHVVTIEDPIEFLFANQKSMFTQREIGTDSMSYTDALMSVLRQDPDVVMIGELRDAVTANICLKASETGHLVVTTLHTPDATSTIKRFCGFFESGKEEANLGRFAESLQAVVSLRLIRKADGSGLLPAVEVMRVTHTIQECIRTPAKHGEIFGHIEKGREAYRMQTFDQHLIELVRSKDITLQTAKMNATRPSDLERSLMLE